MIRKKLVALTALFGAAAMTLSACGASNTGGGSGDSSSAAGPSANIDQKWANCDPASGAKDTSSMDADSKKDITIGAFNGWDESFATAHLLKYVLDKDGYNVKVEGLDAGPGYTGLAGGDIDLITDSWLPLTHADYIKRYGDKLESMGCWYDNAKLTIAVNKDSKAKSIADLESMSSDFGNTLYGIEAGAGETKVVQDTMIPKYGLKKMQLKVSSTPAMLSQLKKATAANQDVAVTLWRPHWAYEAFPVRDLADPKGAMGGAEKIYSFGRPGFGKDNPKAAQLVKNLAFSDEQLSSLENIMFSDSKYGGKNNDKAVAEWAGQNSDWIQKWEQGKLTGNQK
ncbi:glycine betaine ABC transporter substrate-binding protein [Acidipropionibacterium acidipropionici]|uniref:glycine betaine ABC transporter substrate-binding protein n=1 Tax=Acidipropionibacterium acidipropionici TaxID=1748 RepID=UPI00040FB33C|nr:glycine betaine ABC transporter substrate-binding protein [Acidipropionibacterium acidipropionici]ALN14064.1 glycine/betaine ABC transporter substrate-binding protein [Acidipropionibacterium acidipropionici]APZ10174.1 glycine/betaine ABC transporter substrate-binding protein [Acidipropionibacterium acidipropionici]